MTIGIVGLGLIGGSLAKTLKANTDHTVLGLDQNSESVALAQKEGTISGVLTDLSLPDLLILALYPDGVIDFLKENAPRFRKEQIVMDCCGTKQAVCATGFALADRYGFSFVGGHPMAGREFSGYTYAKADLFAGATLLLLPRRPEEPAEAVLTGLAMEMGFGEVKRTDPATHDGVIAYTSQLAHILSNAYVKSPTALKSRGFVGGSFQDLTRVAYLNEDLWTRLFFENKEPLLSELERLEKELAAYHEALQSNDKETMRALLRAGREQKEACGIEK